MQDLHKKYDVQAPRYTSYPTVPYWTEAPDTKKWVQALNLGLSPDSASWSMYLHIPYCETLCTFCGCNTVITKNHKKENPYVDMILKEWELYKAQAPDLLKKPLRQIHFGGGTPTFLSADNLVRLVKPIIDECTIDFDQFEGSIEVDPRRTTEDQLKALYDVGFRRISLGVQDFNKEVQVMVNRVQPYDQTKKITDYSREIGYDSVNFDLIYGLPRQTKEHMIHTVEKTIELRPDRIALYSLAVVPWIKPAQRLFKDEDLPAPQDKRELYEVSRKMLLAEGYIDIGMDHFALPEDSLAKAAKDKTLHRNFMGYADLRTDVLLGLGLSSISESPTCFHQNEKNLPVYERRLQESEIPTLRGHILSEDEQLHREQILQFMTQGQVRLESANRLEQVKKHLQEMVKDELVTFEGLSMTLTSKGQPYLRNACMALDERLKAKTPDKKVFSSSL